MIEVKEILNETKKLQDFQKRQIITGDSMLDCVCYHGFGNIPREIMRMCLEIYIKQGCKNGEYRYQDAVRLVALHKHNTDESGFIKWLGVWSDDFSMMRPRNIQDCCDETRNRLISALFSLLPNGVKINIEELITDLDKIFSEEEEQLELKKTTIMKWQYRIMDVYREKLTENDIYRLEQQLDGNDTVEPMEIDADSIEINIPECLKNEEDANYD